MIKIAARIYRLFYRKYLPQHLLALLVRILTAPLYILLALLLERIASGIEPMGNGLRLIGSAIAICLAELMVAVILSTWTVFKPERDMQSGALGRFLRLPMRLYPETPSGQVSSAAIQYMDGSWFLRDSLHLIHCLFCTGILAWIIARFSLLLAVVSTLPMLLIGIAIQLIQSRWVKTQTKEMEARSRFESFITDTLHGILTVKLFSTESFHTAHFRRLVQEHNWRWLQVGFLLEGFNTLLIGIGRLIIPIFLALGGYLISGGTMTAPQLISLYVVFNILNRHTWTAARIAGWILTDLAQLKMVLDFLDGEEEGDQAFPFKQGQIEFQGVNFAYNDGKAVLDNFSLAIQAGEKVAIVGPSGTGKSTIFTLLGGMYFPQRGQVRVDGIQVTQENAQSLRQRLASVSQDAYLFEANLKFNLTVGRERDDAEMRDALRVVGLEEFVAGLPEGMATQFGPKGFTMSGGEKTRICLARALLMDRPVLLLDEVTANIDSIREEEILDYVLNSLTNKTVVVVSHRLSSARNFPRIVFVEEGKIRGEGTHRELLAFCPRYKEMFGQQVG